MKQCDRCRETIKESHIHFYPSLNESLCDFCLLNEEDEFEDYFIYMTHIADESYI